MVIGSYKQMQPIPDKVKQADESITTLGDIFSGSSATSKAFQVVGTTAGASETIFTGKDIIKWSIITVQDATLVVTNKVDSSTTTIIVKAGNETGFESNITQLVIQETSIDYDFIGEELL